MPHREESELLHKNPHDSVDLHNDLMHIDNSHSWVSINDYYVIYRLLLILTIAELLLLGPIGTA